jgi:tetratricopeptide (TPR) repeat protein
MFLVMSCSTKKNTSGTRFYHATTARFNTLYNGQQAFLEGVDAQTRGHKDDYTRLLPMYLSTNKSTANMGKGNYETAITKCEKAIKVHSIKKRPTVKGNKRRTPKQKAYLARKEFNPYLRHAWLLMAESQFRRGEFIEAASTLNYILRLYSTQPEVVGVAKARLARCYVAMEWPYDAEDILSKMKRDSMTTQGVRERDNTMAAYLIQTHQYKEAIPYLQRAVSATRGKLQKARMNFLLGQLYQQTGDGQQAYKALSRVIRSNPPYELAFNARILQTEVLPRDKYKQMIAKLRRMAKSDKNKDYLDKVYYAIGNIYLSVQDTAHCIGAYERGVLEATQSGIAKAVLLLRLSQLYWDMENYIEAARTYKQCVAILDKEHEEFKESERRSKILTELEPHLTAIKLQDSLQTLAQMDEKDRLEAIDRVIELLKKKEKEEEKLEAKKGLSRTGANARPGATAQTQNRTPATQTAGASSAASSTPKGDWYFYNTRAVSQGVQEFQRRWGQRRNEDNWRISRKASLPNAGDVADVSQDELDNDSLYGEVDEVLSEEEQAIKDSLANDPHHREYYLKQIPMTEEMMDASNQALSNGLYNAGVLEQEQLENFPLAERTMQRLLNDFPEREDLDNIYYHLFLLYGRLGDEEKAEFYRALLLEQYPESRLALLLGNPNYDMIARKGKHVEDSVYQATYAAYQASDYEEVGRNYAYSTENFPEGKNRARLMFVHAMSLLYSGQRDSFLVVLQEVVQKYPKEEVTELANFIVKGVNDGRPLMEDKYDASNIWGRRNRRDGKDSTEVAAELSDERNTNFVFVLAYPTDSLDEDQLLFEMARYNFTNYMVRNFEMEMTEDQGLSTMAIKGFLSFDEVHAYAQKLYMDEHMSTVLKGIRTLLISEENLKLLGKEFSFDEYKAFYDEKFAPLDVPEDLQIDEPTDLEILDPDEVDENPEAEEEEEAVEEDDDDFFPF